MIDSICARKPAKLRVQVCSLPTAVSLAKVVSIRRLVRFKVGLLCSLPLSYLIDMASRSYNLVAQIQPEDLHQPEYLGKGNLALPLKLL